MGCDIHCYAEKKVNGRWELVDRAFGEWKDMGRNRRYFSSDRSYGWFGFLAGVRNYSAIPPITQRRGLPQDASVETMAEFAEWDMDSHSESWLTLEELLNYDYDQIVEDRRYTAEVAPGFFNCGATAKPGEGKKMSLREFLGAFFFERLDQLKKMGAERIVFWFDN